MRLKTIFWDRKHEILAKIALSGDYRQIQRQLNTCTLNFKVTDKDGNYSKSRVYTIIGTLQKSKKATEYKD